MKISLESAQMQLALLIDKFEIREPTRPERDAFPQAIEAFMAYQENKETLLDAIQRGRLEIAEGLDGKLTVTQIVDGDKPIEWGELTGALVAEADKATGGISRVQMIAGALMGIGPQGVGRLKRKDYAVTQALATLYLR